MIVGTIACFALIGFNVDPSRARVLRTQVDDLIPFWPWSVFAYSWVYTSMLYPLFVVRCPRLFKRSVLAYALVAFVSLLFFALFPVTSLGLRPGVTGLDASVFCNWGVRLTFFVDPPTNLYPSMHLSMASIAMLAAWKARPLFGVLALPVVLGIALSICTMKQHYILDGVSALALVAVVYDLVLGPYDAREVPLEDRSFSWRGPLGYLVFHCMVYLGLYLAFRAGVRPCS